MTDERLEDQLARLAREQADADRRYNEALTALDQSLRPAPPMPHPPPAYDPAKLEDLNRAWDILPGGPPSIDGSLKGRLRAFVWRLVGPALDAQRTFNAALVEHLNRNIAAHEEAAKAAETTIACLTGEVEARVAFEARLIPYLQTITLFVDTKDRGVAGGTAVVNAALSAITDDWLKRWESLGAREQRFLKRVAGIDDVKQTAVLAQQTALALKREVERLVAASPAERRAPADGAAEASVTPDLDSFKYLGFEDAFRGSTDEIRGRLASYLPIFTGASDVLDIGCGRGEFLELLRTHGVGARGLDTNHAMVEFARARGLDVVEADALSHLRGLPDHALGGLFASQVVEHLEPSYLMALIETAAHKLRPGSALVLETINPACWLAFFESYIRDLTHVRPLHPETLQFLVRASGFHDVDVVFSSPVAEAARLTAVPPPSALAAPTTPADAALADLLEAFNDTVAKLNARLFTNQDYAVVARA